MGGKQRIAARLLEAMEKELGGPPATLYEPFMGGANFTAAAGKAWPNCDIFASEVIPSIALFWNAILAGWIPPPDVISRDEWAFWKNAPESVLKGYHGMASSYNGRYFAGYGSAYTPEEGAKCQTRHNYTAEGQRGALRQALSMGRVRVDCASYAELRIPSGTVVYCDPPYEATGNYAGQRFDHGDFWCWADALSARCDVFVSEYAPREGWREVLALSTVPTMGGGRGSAKRPEKIDRLLYRGPKCL